MAITTIAGKNNYMAQSELAKIRDEFVGEHGDSGVLTLEAENTSVEELLQSTMSQGLFSQDSLVILRGIADNKVLQEDLKDRISDVPESAQLVVFEPNLDKRTAFSKTLQKETHFIDCKPLDENGLARWVTDEAKRLNLEISSSAARHLIARAGDDQWVLHNELAKLANLGTPIDNTVIDENVDELFQDSIFNMLEAAFSKRTNDALELYRKMLANQVESFYVFSMIVWQLHILLIVAHAGSRSADQIAKDHKLSPYVVGKTQNLFRQSSKTEVKTIVDLASEIDWKSKTKSGYDMNAAVDLLIARIGN